MCEFCPTDGGRCGLCGNPSASLKPGDVVYRNGKRIGVAHCWTRDGVSVLLDERVTASTGMGTMVFDHLVVTPGMVTVGGWSNKQ